MQNLWHFKIKCSKYKNAKSTLVLKIGITRIEPFLHACTCLNFEC